MYGNGPNFFLLRVTPQFKTLIKKCLKNLMKILQPTSSFKLKVPLKPQHAKLNLKGNNQSTVNSMISLPLLSVNRECS